MRLTLMGLGVVVGVSSAFGAEYLVKMERVNSTVERRFLASHGGKLELVSQEGRVYKWTTDHAQSLSALRSSPLSWNHDVVRIEENKKLHILLSPKLEENRGKLMQAMGRMRPMEAQATPYPDNPDFASPSTYQNGADPLLSQSWGMFSIDAQGAWQKTPKGKGIVVAVTDTGVDYNHQDLVNNMWRNSKEIAGDGIDNDGNGYVDDIVGWDFAADDNKPYDLTLSLFDIILKGGNPGHGTHVSGVIGSMANNGNGTAGVAPDVKIMALRFITESGSGTTDAAIKAIDYAVANGANIINASWGGESDGQSEEDKILKEAIERANAKGVIFMVAAGNGRMNPSAGTSAGFDIDSDAKPVYPCAYEIDNVVGVAAVDSQNEIAGFSNWGKKRVKLGAPGVKILSTVPGNRYQDTIISLGSMQVTWDGTSMATPFAAGAAAVIWSQDTNQKAQDVIAKLLELTSDTAALKDKVATDGRLDLHGLK